MNLSFYVFILDFAGILPCDCIYKDFYPAIIILEILPCDCKYERNVNEL
uniref:Uncharacterized protein n=1 Tax=Podoviridae sp. ctUm43 TaxID=2827738 RepID=A0A8S5SXY1_9CAUD|nr:MAG TPA: hypothetical protein [Podoviridae sp. ctUm43]